MKSIKDCEVLLIRPAYSLNIYRVYGKLPRYREIRPPLSLMYIAAYLEQNGFRINILDAEKESLDNENILKRILEISPKILFNY